MSGKVHTIEDSHAIIIKEIHSIKEEQRKIEENQSTHNKDDDERFGSLLDMAEAQAKLIKELTESVREVIELYKSFGTIKKTIIWVVGAIAGVAVFVTSWRTIIGSVKDIFR